MPAIANVEDLATKFGIEALPDNVKRLAQLVSRQTAPREEIAKIICGTKICSPASCGPPIPALSARMTMS